MMTPRPDGSITLDFAVERDEGQVEQVQVRVKPIPRVGTLKRISAERAAIAAKSDEYAAGLREDAETSVAQLTMLLNDRYENDALDFWHFVLVGDESFAGLGEPAPPEDRGQWPPYLMSVNSIAEALAHWKSVPLDRGVMQQARS